jgi:hypothetical protein
MLISRSEVFVGNSLVYMDAKCGSMEDAWRVFNKLPMSDVVSWNAMTLAHGNVGKGGRHWSYSNKCNRKVCHRTLSLSWGSECMCQCIAIEACRLAQ